MQYGRLASYTQQLHSISVNHSPNPNPDPNPNTTNRTNSILTLTLLTLTLTLTHPYISLLSVLGYFSMQYCVSKIFWLYK